MRDVGSLKLPVVLGMCLGGKRPSHYASVQLAVSQWVASSTATVVVL